MSHDHSLDVAFMDLRTGARWSSLSVRTLRRFIKAGRLAVYRTTAGGKLLIRPRDLEACLIRESKPRADLDALVNSVARELR
jgi:predicted site-specific integrase-resolvase